MDLDKPQGPTVGEVIRDLLQRNSRAGKEASDALLKYLGPWDLVYLRREANKVVLDSSAFASWLHLPSDIIYDITAYLPIGDLLKCRQVSQVWRQTWLQDAVVTRVLKREFPGAFELSPEHQSKEKVLMDSLYARRKKRVKELRGTFIPWFTRSALQIGTTNGGAPVCRLSQELEYDHDQAVAPKPLYNDGKAAWHLSGLRFGVDDIKAARRTIYTLPVDRRRPVPRMSMVALTGKLLIVSAESTPAKLHVLHLEDEQWTDITLPAPLHACYAEDQSLVAVCRNKDSLHWSWGGTCVEIQVGEGGHHRPPRETQGPFLNGFPGALFHPTRKDVVFLVRLYVMDLAVQRRESKNLFGTTVVKYVQQGPGLPFVATKRYARTVPHPLEFGPRGELEEPLDEEWYMDASPSMRKTNNHGRYSLFYFFLFSMISDAAMHSIETQCFNVVTEKFFCPTLTFANPLGVTHHRRRHAGRPQAHSRMFDRRVSVAEQVHIWHNQFFSLTWQMMGWTPHPPSLNVTDLLGEGVSVAKARNVPPTSQTLVKHPQEDAILQGQRSQEEYGSGFWRIFADDNLLLALTDVGYYVVDCPGGAGEYDWLKECLNNKVSLGLHYPHWNHTGFRDKAVEVAYANRELEPHPWVDPHQVEEDMEENRDEGMEEDREQVMEENTEESREEDMEDASDSDMDVEVDADSVRALT